MHKERTQGIFYLVEAAAEGKEVLGVQGQVFGVAVDPFTDDKRREPGQLLAVLVQEFQAAEERRVQKIAETRVRHCLGIELVFSALSGES